MIKRDKKTHLKTKILPLFPVHRRIRKVRESVFIKSQQTFLCIGRIGISFHFRNRNKPIQFVKLCEIDFSHSTSGPLKNCSYDLML